MKAPSLRHLLGVYCGEVEHLDFASDFNGSKPRERVADLTLSIDLLLDSRHHIPVVLDHSTKSRKDMKRPKSVLAQSVSAPRKESSFELQATSLCNG